jgi:gamma-glutamyl-gamma-aminobutyrate hydrolase PuuD
MYTNNFQGFVDTAKDSKFSQVTGKKSFQMNSLHNSLVINNASLKRSSTKNLTYVVQNVNTNPKSKLKKSFGSSGSSKSKKYPKNTVRMLTDIGEEQEFYSSEQDN